jgi:hypothetical protein
VVATHANIDVRSHVHEVPGLGSEFADAIRAGDSFLGRRTGLDEVNVKMICTGVGAHAREDRLNCSDGFFGFGFGRFVRLPIVPR